MKPTYRVKFRRRRENKTDYRKRLALLNQRELKFLQIQLLVRILVLRRSEVNFKLFLLQLVSPEVVPQELKTMIIKMWDLQFSCLMISG